MAAQTKMTSSSMFEQYELKGVKFTSDRELGHDSYATVHELEYMGLKCAGKKIHDLLLRQRNTSDTLRRFEEECRLLSQVRHPNIVQFLGVHFQHEEQVPILIMEYLPTNLTSCIEQYGILPKEIGYSILHDVALGLYYLHSQTPPIIHRDLSSNNVLLTANMTGKISDLGVARIVNLTPFQFRNLTQGFNTTADIYMPPEVNTNPNYDTSVDIYSYGILMIHMFSGKWPEAERRELFLQDEHPLMDLILRCINKDRHVRPHASEIVERLAAMVLQFPASFANRLETLRHIEALMESREAENRQGKATRQDSIQSPSVQWDLPGVEVCGEMSVVVHSSRYQPITWEGFGLRLHIQEDSLPAGMEQCTLNIKASLAGQYEFPENSSLVSAVFWLRCEPTCKFTKPVTVEIQHCAKSENVDSLKMKFVRALCSQAQLPYTFKELGGDFNRHSSYGVIQVNGFSGLAVTQEGSEEREYCSQLFYLGQPDKCNIDFVVTWNTEAHLTAVKEKYERKGAILDLEKPVDFEFDAITLDIPVEGITVKDWEVTPKYLPVVTKKQVDNFREGKSTPCCQLLAELSEKKKEITSVKHPITLKGSKQQGDFILIILPQGGQVGSPQQTPIPPPQVKLTDSNYATLLQQLEKHASKFREIGTELGFTQGELDNIQSAPRLQANSPKSWLGDMLSQWLEWAPGDGRGSKDFATLEGLRDALRKANLGATAHVLHLQS